MAGVWSEVPAGLNTAGGLPIIHISVGSASQVLALNSETYPAGNNVYVLNSAGTGWTALTGWLSPGEIGADGSIVGIGADGNVWRYIGGSWSELYAGGNFTEVAVGSAASIWAVNSLGALYGWNGTTFVAVSAPPFTLSHATDALAALSENYVAALDTSGGIHVSTNAGQTWSTVSGTASAIAGGGGIVLFTRSGSSAYHVNLTVPALTNTASHSAACFIIKEEGGGSHLTCGSESVTAKAYFGGVGGAHGTAGVSATTDGTEPATITASATEQGATCDPFYAASSANCQPYDDGFDSDLCYISGPDGGYEETTCLGSAGPTGITFSAGASETLYAIATSTKSMCSWNKSCPVGQTATCGVGTIYGTPPCSNFVELYYAWYNFGAGNVCLQYGLGIGSAVPVGGCD